MRGPVVRLSARFRASLKDLSDEQFQLAEKALREIPGAFGTPHVHSGISIRRLHEDIFECRAGADLRLLFRASKGSLDFFFVGNHDAVKRLIRSMK